MSVASSRSDPDEPLVAAAIKRKGTKKSKCINICIKGQQVSNAYPVATSVLVFALLENIVEEYIITIGGSAQGAEQRLEVWCFACTHYFAVQSAPLPLIEAGWYYIPVKCYIINYATRYHRQPKCGSLMRQYFFPLRLPHISSFEYPAIVKNNTN